LFRNRKSQSFIHNRKSSKLNGKIQPNTIALDADNNWEIPEKIDVSLMPQSGLNDIFEVMRGTPKSLISSEKVGNKIFAIQNTGKELLQGVGIPRLKDEAWR